MKASFPTCGSAAILWTSAENGCPGSTVRCTSSPDLGSIPTTGGTSSGDGK
jgi:hypothetical protein